MVGRQTGDQEEASPSLLRTTTLGKLFTPMCLDADCIRYFSLYQGRRSTAGTVKVPR